MVGSKTIGDYVSLQRGVTYKGNLVGKPGPALLGLGSIHPGGGFRADYKTYGGECPEKLMLRPGELFVSLKGATKDSEMIGSVARVPASVFSGRLTQDTVKLVFHDPDHNLTAFLYWILRTPHYRKYCAGRATGSAVVALSREDFLSYPVPRLDPGKECIVRLLEDIESKIELNRNMNGTLEAMARAVFKSWFVDFDPVRARAEGRQPFGMDAQIAAFFPSSFEDLPFGKTPMGWTPIKLSCVARFVKGVSYRSSELQESNAALVTLKSVARGGGYREDGLKSYSGQFKSEQVVQQGDIVVAHTDVTQAADVLGRVARVRADLKHSTLVASLDLVIVRPKDATTSREFLYELLSRDEFKDHAYGYSNGTTVLHLSHKALPEYLFPMPPTPVREAFTNIVAPLFQQMDTNRAQSQTLLSIRNALLPKLISGDIRVRASE
jgi:restriction endonuclease S subunit